MATTLRRPPTQAIEIAEFIAMGFISRLLQLLLSGMCAALLAGCATSQTASQRDAFARQTYQYAQAWVGEYSGRVDHGVFHLVSGPDLDSSEAMYNTDGWIWDWRAKVKLTIGFEPDGRGGRLHITLTPEWWLALEMLAPESRKQMLTQGFRSKVQPRRYDIRVPDEVMMFDDHRIEGMQNHARGDATSGVSKQTTEFVFELNGGTLSGHIKYRSRDEGARSTVRDDRYETRFKNLAKSKGRR